jgi:hypothetical protein
MALTEQQLEDLYRNSIESRQDIIWMKAELLNIKINNNVRLDKLEEKLIQSTKDLNKIIQDYKFLKGRLSMFIISFSIFFAGLFNVIGWIISWFRSGG